MKIQIKNLKPNPFRDMENYPINEEKVQSLTNSINQTGFWDNILARKNNGNIEIAYGHHRLVVLKKLFKPDDYVDIPVKELDDPTMIRIMANENDESWGTNPKIIDETVRITKIYLENHLEIVENLLDRTPVLPIGAMIISKFLGGNWYTRRVKYALERLGFGESKEIDTEATEMFENESQARTFVSATKQIKNITPGQQKQAAKRIIERQDFSETGIKSALLDEKYSKKKTEKDQREKNEIHFKNFMVETTKDIKRLNDKFLQLFELQTKYNFTFEIYNNSDEADDFRCEMLILIDYLKKFSAEGVKQNAKNKLLQIGD